MNVKKKISRWISLTPIQGSFELALEKVLSFLGRGGRGGRTLIVNLNSHHPFAIQTYDIEKSFTIYTDGNPFTMYYSKSVVDHAFVDEHSPN